MSETEQYDTTVTAKLPAHRIEFSGFERVQAIMSARKARLAGRKVEMVRERVSGSRLSDPNPWWYQVVSFPQ